MILKTQQLLLSTNIDEMTQQQLFRHQQQLAITT